MFPVANYRRLCDNCGHEGYPRHQQKATRFGPYSRALQRGALGDAIDGRSREGKFLRRTELELLGQLGREASPSASGFSSAGSARATLQLEFFDQKLASGNEFTGA